MKFYIVADIGAFLRWIFKGCKTKLEDEKEGNFKPLILGSYILENYIIGLLFIIFTAFLFFTLL